MQYMKGVGANFFQGRGSKIAAVRSWGAFGWRAGMVRRNRRKGGQLADNWAGNWGCENKGKGGKHQRGHRKGGGQNTM